MSDPWKDLFAEQSLWEIYRKGEPIYRGSRFNLIVAAIGLLGLAAFALAHFFQVGPTRFNGFDFPNAFAAWASAGLSYTANILGFLIAGFAILFAVLRPETAMRLRRIRRPGYDLDELKLVFVNFVALFAHHAAFLFWCFSYVVAGGKNGPFELAGRYLSLLLPTLPVLITHIVFVAWGLWFLVLALKVKSFVYNLYQTLLVVMIDAMPDGEL